MFNIFKDFGKLLLLIFLSSIIGYILIIGSYMIPNSLMLNNIKESAEYLERQGCYPTLTSKASSSLDNFTDALMLLESVYKSEYPAYKSSLLNERESVSETPFEDLLILYNSDETYSGNIGRISYPRYWHGYHVILNPLLCFFNIHQIRYVNFLCQFIVSLIVILLFIRRNKILEIIPYLFSILFLYPPATARSLQFSTCFYLMNIGLIIVNYNLERKDKEFYFIFAIMGILTSYFDFLTYPLVTLGLPLISLSNSQSEKSIKDISKLIFFSSAAWFIGYAGMWSMKWIYATLITNENVIKNAYNAIKFRTGSQWNGYISLKSTVKANLKAIIHTPVSYIYSSIIAFEILEIVKKINRKKQLNWKILLTNTFIAIYPIFWIIISRNHSYIHSWFTHKIFIISIYSVLYCLLKLEINKDN